MTRRALLLAISDYDPLPPLPYVTRDIPRMRRALASAGFDPGAIEAIGPGAEQGRSGVLTNTKLRSSIRQFLKNANIDDDLLLFLSGHGIEFQGRRIMLPPDYDLQEPQSPGDLIWDGWISEQARGSAARSIIVLIDACRDGAHYELAADKSAGAAGALADRPLENAFNTGIDGPIVAFLYSCSVGEQSGIDRLDQSCSAFTRAMAEAFGMETGPSELLPLAEAAKIRLSTYSDSRQTLVITGHDGRAGAWRRLTAKVDEAMRFRDRMDRSTWVKLVEQTELFRLVERSLGSFALQIRAVALRAEEQVAEAAQTLPAQRWRDEAAWKRMLDRLHSTFLIRKQESPIRAEEAAILLAVPFVYETVLAAVETRLSIADAIPDPETATSSGHMVAAWRNAWRESDAARMHSGLVIRGNHEAAEDQACWALVTFCHGTGELWDAQGGRPHRSGWVLDSLASLLSAAPFAEVMQDRRIPEILSMPRLMRLARLMFASFEDVTLDAAEDISTTRCSRDE
jgi:hypothetical protein